MKARRVSRAFCFGCRATPIYLEMRSCERTVPICWKVVIIWLAVVSITNFASLAQFLNSADSAAGVHLAGADPAARPIVHAIVDRGGHV
jgi:hypothetical protein